MSTTSSSRAERGAGGAAWALALALLAGLAASSAAADRPRVPPEAPRASPPAAAGPPAAAAGGGLARTPVVLRAVAVRRVPASEAAERMGDAFAASAREPVAIEVATAAPLGDLGRTSSPVIVLNGAILAATIPRLPDRLVAYLPDPDGLLEINEVEVVWLGDEARTRSPRPLTFRAADLR